MEDEDGMESFEIDDRDLEYAMNPGRKRYQTKEQSALGMWADSDSDGEGERPSFGGRERKRPNYSAPVNFISGGFKKGSGDKEKNEEEEDKEEIINAFSLPTKRPKPQQKAPANVFAGMRQSATRSSVDPSEFAGWTKHGKGSVIMNMMKSMGYKSGEGLGKDSQGIVEPVQAAVRPGRAAVGAYGKEATGPKFGESAADAQKRQAEESSGGMRDPREEKIPNFLPKGSWRKSTKVKTQYKTIDDVIKEGGSIGHRAAQHSGTKVIDMTGPEQRVFTGYDSLAMKTLRAGEETHKAGGFDIPELTHNLNLLIDLTEEEIRRTNQQVHTLKDQSTALRYDLKLLREDLIKEEDEFERLKEVYKILESLQNLSTMKEFQEEFVHLKENFGPEYHLLELDKVAVPCVMPLIKDYFSHWNPLNIAQCSYGIEMVREWREILTPSQENTGMLSAGMSSNGSLVPDRLNAYDRLLWDGWMPAFRSAILKWDPRDEMEVMIKVLEVWFPVMPAWMREKIIEQQMIPRLSSRIDEWDPLTDATPIHNWLVPWLERCVNAYEHEHHGRQAHKHLQKLLGDHLLPVFSPIRQKLAKALKLWQPKDISALVILLPWKGVWTPGTMAAFLGQNIVPKLKSALEHMEFNPKENPEYAEVGAVIEWLTKGMLSVEVIADVFVSSFFPQWYDKLVMWLDSPSCDLSQVKMWLAEWNARFPPQLVQHPSVKECLRKGLLALAGQRPPRPQAAPIVNPVAFITPPTLPSMNIGRLPMETAQLSLKDVVEITAARRGITYVPQQNRFKEGKQVYWFGTVSIFMDRGVIYALDTTTFEWNPIGLDNLLALA